jgi:acyl-CoA thioester hydrolase
LNTPDKTLESKALIRFQDCDPFNHLNNAAYLNYLVNAREDQLLAQYGINIYDVHSLGGKSWVVSSNQIAYLRPARLMEQVVMQSQLIGYTDSETHVELRMLNHNKSELKAVMWGRYVHIDLKTQKRTTHDATLMELFEQALLPVKQQTFEQRAAFLKQEYVKKSVSN